MSTVVTVGNGTKAKFWESSWLDGKAPRDLAPNLYKSAWRKNQTIKEDLINDNWMRGLWHMSDAIQMAELVTLWALIIDVNLTDEEDTILWKWIGNRIYISKSAYKAHFVGSYCTFDSTAIWKAKREGKHHFFAWLLVQRKILIADKLKAHNSPCQLICSLCDQDLESANDLSLQCVSAQEVWLRVAQWTNGLVHVPTRNASPGSLVEHVDDRDFG